MENVFKYKALRLYYLRLYFTYYIETLLYFAPTKFYIYDVF